MGKAVVASDACAAGIDARIGRDLASATGAPDFAERVEALVANPQQAAAMGAAARACVVGKYSWSAQLGRIDRHLAPAPESAAIPA